MARKAIDTDRVQALLRCGLTVPEIGPVLAKEECRAVPYLVQSVYAAMRRAGISSKPHPIRDELLIALMTAHGRRAA